MGNGANFSTAPDMLLFAADLLRRERFPKAYYDLLFAPSFDGDGHRRSFGWDMTAEKSTFTSWTKTAFSDKAICHTGWTGPAIAVDPVRDFLGQRASCPLRRRHQRERAAQVSMSHVSPRLNVSLSQCLSPGLGSHVSGLPSFPLATTIALSRARPATGEVGTGALT